MRKARATQRMNRAIGTTLARVTMALVIAALCTPWRTKACISQSTVNSPSSAGQVVPSPKKASAPNEPRALNSTTR